MIVVLLTWKCLLRIEVNEVELLIELTLEVDSQNRVRGLVRDPGRFHVKPFEMS